jgi:arginase family enzyme
VLHDSREQLAAILTAGHLPVVLGGDCTLAVVMVSAAIDAGKDVALLYFNGGPDLRTLADYPEGSWTPWAWPTCSAFPAPLRSWQASAPPPLAGTRAGLLFRLHAGLTIAEFNPDHGDPDGSTARILATAIAAALTPLIDT